METIKEAGNMALNAATKMEIPSNETLVSGIDKAKKALRTTVLESDVSGGKKKVAKEVESILESIETFLNENNDGDALQSFFSDSKKVVEELTSEVKDDAEKTKKLKGDLKEIFGASKDLSLALLKDKDLRELMMNSAQLLQRFIVSITRSKGIDVPEEILDKLGMSESAGSGKKRKTSKKGSKSAPKKVTEKEMKELGSELLKTLQSFKEKEEYQKALDSFFTLFRHISDRVESIKENPELSLDKNSSLKKMLEDGQKVMEGFTGSKSLTSLFESLSGIFSLDSKDLKEYFSSWKDYLAEIKENPELLTGKDAAKKIGELIHKAKDLFQEDSIRDAFNNFFGEFGDFLSNIQPGNMGSKLASGASELMGHLVGKGGKITISSLSQALPQVKSLVMPLLLSQLDKLPFPKLEGKSDNWTWAVEGIQFAASDIMTDRIKMDFHTSTDVKLKDLSNELSTAELSLTIKGIKSSIKDIKFEYKRDGLVPIQDAGLANVTFGGEGADLEVKWYLESQGSNTPQITEAEVSCKIDKLDVFVKQAHHEFLDSIVTSLFSGFLKHEFEKQIESGLIKMVVKSAVELNKVLNHFAEKEESTPAAK